MNWYNIFYWVTVADNIKSFFDTTSNIFTWLAVLSFIVYIILSIVHSVETNSDSESDNTKAWGIAKNAFRGVFYTTLALSLITWFGYMACPSKKDALIIIAGGTVGNFITSDSSSKAIPAEAMLLLRDKIRSEIREVNLQNLVDEKVAEQVDTLAGKTKEELLQIIKEAKK